MGSPLSYVKVLCGFLRPGLLLRHDRYDSLSVLFLGMIFFGGRGGGGSFAWLPGFFGSLELLFRRTVVLFGLFTDLLPETVV